MVVKYREVEPQMKYPCMEDLRYEINISKAAKSICPQYKGLKVIQQISYIINQPTLCNSPSLGGGGVVRSCFKTNGYP